MQAKVCGLKTTEQVESCVEHGANFCGFILNYRKSHRFIDYNTADRLTKINKKNTSYVGVPRVRPVVRRINLAIVANVTAHAKHTLPPWQS